jgi:hypothetical protein
LGAVADLLQQAEGENSKIMNSAMNDKQGSKNDEIDDR